MDDLDRDFLLDDLETEHQGQVALLRRELEKALQDRAECEMKLAHAQTELTKQCMHDHNLTEQILTVLADLKHGMEQIRREINSGFLKRIFGPIT